MLNNDPTLRKKFEAKYEDTTRDINVTIVDSLNKFLSDLTYNGGTRHKSDQQAVDAVLAAAMWGATTDEQRDEIKKALRMSHKAFKKIVSIVEQLKPESDSDIECDEGDDEVGVGKIKGPVWSHSQRARRKDCKADIVCEYIYKWCHDDTWDRSSRLDTGEGGSFKRVRTPSGDVELHGIRRWNDDVQTQDQLYELWQQSEYARQFADDYPEFGSVCKTIFLQSLCPCCKFGEDEMCADIIMSGAEEARAGYQRMLKRKEVRAKMDSCECEFHSNENSEEIFSIFLETVEKIVGRTLCPKKEYPELARKPFLGYESVSKEKIPKLHDLGCINGSCKSENCGVDAFFAGMETCPILCQPAAEENCDGIEASPIDHTAEDDEEESNSADDDDEEEEEEEEENNARQEDRPCSWHTEPYKCVNPHLPLLQCVQKDCVNMQHHLCKNVAEQLMYEKAFPDNDFPPEHPNVNQFEYGNHVCPDCHPHAHAAQVLSSSNGEKKYRVKKWVKKDIPKTDGKKQNELVDAYMTPKELLDHVKDCTAKAREHYVKYRYVDWTFDCWVHNTLPKHHRIIVKTDFSASPDLRGKRVACGAVDSHAVLCVMHVYSYERDEDGREKCLKRSYIFIGSSDSAGKKNDWKFHIACLEHIIKVYRDERGIRVDEVIVITDRCPGQYACRQNFLQVSKLSMGDQQPTLKHLFACVHRFKGPHDGDGGEIKRKIRESVRRGDEGTTAFDFFESSKERASFLREKDPGMNHLCERVVNYVVYSKEEFDDLNQGAHKGHIVYADMEHPDDTDPIPDTSKIYEIVAVSASDAMKCEQVADFGPVVSALYDLEHDGKDDLGNNAFMDQFNATSASAEACARHDVISIERRQLSASDAKEVVDNRLKDWSKQKQTAYVNEFIIRAGKLQPQKTPAVRRKALDKWVEATPIDRLHCLRSKKQIQKLHMQFFSTNDDKEPNGVVKKLLGDVLGFDLEKAPARARNAVEFHRNDKNNRDLVKALYPGATEKEVNRELNAKFEGFDEDEQYRWLCMELRDKARFNKELMTLKEPGENDYFLRRSNFSCTCEKCIINKVEECKSPFPKDIMRRKIVRMKLKDSRPVANEGSDLLGKVNEEDGMDISF